MAMGFAQFLTWFLRWSDAAESANRRQNGIVWHLGLAQLYLMLFHWPLIDKCSWFLMGFDVSRKFSILFGATMNLNPQPWMIMNVKMSCWIMQKALKSRTTRKNQTTCKQKKVFYMYYIPNIVLIGNYYAQPRKNMLFVLRVYRQCGTQLESQPPKWREVGTTWVDQDELTWDSHGL